MAPHVTGQLPGGGEVALRPLALAVADAHLALHPEDVERYGAELAHAWCTHDFQHVLAWAVGDLDLDGQVAWLARVLAARDYPVANLISCLHTAAGVVRERIPAPEGEIVAGRLEAAAASIG